MTWPESVAVIGAGPAGLAAAWDLVRTGRRVTLYEERGVPGGRMRSDMMDGASVDVAVQLLSSTYRELLSLAKQTGAAQHVVRAPGRDALWRKGKPHHITYGSVPSMITSSALPTGLKVKLAAKYLPFLGREARGLDANDPAGTGGIALDGVSIDTWGREHLGDEFIELLAYPLLAAYYGGLPEETSAAMYHALARVGLDVQVLAVRSGIGNLASAIAESMRVKGLVYRNGTRVEQVSVGNRVEVVSEGRTEVFEAAVLAVPAPRLLQMMQPPEELGAWLNQVRMLSTTTLALLVEGRLDADYFGLSFPRGTPPGDALVALCVESRKTAGLVQAGKEAVVAFPAPTLARELASAEPTVVVERMLPAIDMVFPGIRSRVLRARVHRISEGYTVFWPGYLEHLLRFNADWLPRTLVLAGDYLVSPTVEGAVISGRRAASLLLRRAMEANRG
jgi:oxygen-dependent protoporphyrinogen oxidase